MIAAGHTYVGTAPEKLDSEAYKQWLPGYMYTLYRIFYLYVSFPQRPFITAEFETLAAQSPVTIFIISV